MPLFNPPSTVNTDSLVKLSAPGSTLFIDATGGSDLNDGFTTPVQTTGRLTEILEGYSFEGSSVTVFFSNFTSGFSFNGSGLISGINNLDFELIGNTITSGTISISNVTSIAGQVRIADAVLDGASPSISAFNVKDFEVDSPEFRNITSGDLIRIRDVDNVEVDGVVLNNVSADSLIKLDLILRATEYITLDMSAGVGTNSFSVALVDLTEGLINQLTFESTPVIAVTGKKLDAIGSLNGGFAFFDQSSLTETIASTFPASAVIGGTNIRGSFADDTAAGVGGVQSGHLYENTTLGAIAVKS